MRVQEGRGCVKLGEVALETAAWMIKRGTARKRGTPWGCDEEGVRWVPARGNVGRDHERPLVANEVRQRALPVRLQQDSGRGWVCSVGARRRALHSRTGGCGACGDAVATRRAAPSRAARARVHLRLVAVDGAGAKLGKRLREHLQYTNEETGGACSDGVLVADVVNSHL